MKQSNVINGNSFWVLSRQIKMVITLPDQGWPWPWPGRSGWMGEIPLGCHGRLGQRVHWEKKK